MKFFKNYISKFYLQNVYERPSKRVRKCLLKRWNELKSTHSFYNEIERHAEHLVDQGYTILPEYYKGSLLSELKSDFFRKICEKSVFVDPINQIHQNDF